MKPIPIFTRTKIMKLDSNHIDLANRKIALTCFTTKPPDNAGLLPFR
jgi:hypothetical protein